jgi:hypothetical protein
MPEATCPSQGGSSDGGAASDGGGASTPDGGAASDGGAGADGSSSDAGGTNYNTPAQCSSGQNWNGLSGPTMQPGAACGGCHVFTVAGTVYPTAHEPTYCNGANVSGTTVVITDAKGHVTTLQVNSAGNFYAQTSIVTPFQAKVVHGGNERAMSESQTSGDCNSCHTQQGANSAPGRIILP